MLHEMESLLAACSGIPLQSSGVDRPDVGNGRGGVLTTPEPPSVATPMAQFSPISPVADDELQTAYDLDDLEEPDVGPHWPIDGALLSNVPINQPGNDQPFDQDNNPAAGVGGHGRRPGPPPGGPLNQPGTDQPSNPDEDPADEMDDPDPVPSPKVPLNPPGGNNPPSDLEVPATDRADGESRACCSRDEDRPSAATSGRLPVALMAMNTWRNHAGGLMWILMDQLASQGHASTDADFLENIQTMAPPVGGDPRVLNIFAVTVQTLCCMYDTQERFHIWAQREGADVSRQTFPTPVGAPSLHPWSERTLWSYGIWAMTSAISERFPAQTTPLSEHDFLL